MALMEKLNNEKQNKSELEVEPFHLEKSIFGAEYIKLVKIALF